MKGWWCAPNKFSVGHLPSPLGPSTVPLTLILDWGELKTQKRGDCLNGGGSRAQLSTAVKCQKDGREKQESGEQWEEERTEQGATISQT